MATIKNLKIEKRIEYGSIDYWTEYLFIEKLSEDKFMLSIKSNITIDSTYDGQYIQEFYDKKSEEYHLPKVINGLEVLGWESEFLLSKELEYNISHETLEINKSDYKNKVDNWLKDLNWQLDINNYKKIENFIFD